MQQFETGKVLPINIMFTVDYFPLKFDLFPSPGTDGRSFVWIFSEADVIKKFFPSSSSFREHKLKWIKCYL